MSSLGSVLFDVWSSTYNAPESILPFITPLSIWFSCWAYCKSKKMDYARWYDLHIFHHVAAMTLGSLSLYFDDDAIFNERIVILWSMPYFMIDIVDCIWERHLTYAIHALFCLSLGVANFSIPLFRELRLNAKAVFIEASTPIFYQAKQHRNPYVFILFAITFTCCRIIWIPFILKALRDNGLAWVHPGVLGVIGFYGLNLFWYYKIIGILITGNMESDKANEPPSSSSKVDKKMD
mmetsp:Transcript_8159/g.22142  ORF Transcript_8159/g.22142 Transcript_8159/m.22142 type:complete len:236 (-) Transcript_8159:335-1042(-)